MHDFDAGLYPIRLPKIRSGKNLATHSRQLRINMYNKDSNRLQTKQSPCITSGQSFREKQKRKPRPRSSRLNPLAISEAIR
ncbi:MAG: hypothetical protein D3925_05745 [Candidatus Electrothrix sp. AR5]|nr:hypothetical protein [Candidatus Electrothrix sp. AR5]